MEFGGGQQERSTVTPLRQEVLENLNALLEAVCDKNSFVLAEALCPRDDGNCLIQSSAFHCKNKELEGFQRASQEFVFPLQIGIPGRVWKNRKLSWHGNVSSLPSTIFLRAELAKQSSLRGCVAIPLQEVDSENFFVIIFYSHHELASPAAANQVLDTVGQCLERLSSPAAAFAIPPPAPAAASVVVGSRSVLSKSRSWLKCELALQKPMTHRANEDVEDIMKFTRRLDFFKHMAEGQRYNLCRNMSLHHIAPGTVLHRSTDVPDPLVWRIVVLGRVAVQVTEPYGNPSYAVWHFDSGQTFAQTYLKLFVNELDITAHIEASTQCQCLLVHIPPEMRQEFKSWTRPLWYEELTRYFGMSINEAGEALGMCTSAIKKICRRHGIARWPHRKIASVEKSIQTIQQRIREYEAAAEPDEAAICNLRTELLDAVRQRMQCGSNKAQLVDAAGGEEEEAMDVEEDEGRRGAASAGKRRGRAAVKVAVAAADDDGSQSVDDGELGEALPERNENRGSGGGGVKRARGVYIGAVEYGIMHHQLNPMESVDIFDETPTQAPMVSVKPETIGHDGSIIHNNLLPLHLNADPDAIGGQPPPRTMSIGQASAETLASIFGSAGLPAHIPGGGGGREGRRGETEDTASSNCAARTSPNGGGVERSSQEMGGQGGMMPLEGRSGASARGGGRIGQEYSALADSLNVHAAFGAPSMPVTEEGSQKHERHRRSRSHDERRSKRSKRPSLVVRGATVPEEVQQAMRQWNLQRAQQGLPPVHMEIN